MDNVLLPVSMIGNPSHRNPPLADFYGKGFYRHFSGGKSPTNIFVVTLL